MKKFELSKRLQKLPPYLFAEIDRQKTALKKKGINFIDVSIGDPDIASPCLIIDTLYRAAQKKENQKYALDQGSPKLRKSIKAWMKKRFRVVLSEDREILPLIGSKEGLVHFPLAFVNPGERVLIPSPGYPGYRGAALFAGAKVYEVPLHQRNDFLPELARIPRGVRNKAKLIYLNYPNNPTTTVAPRAFLVDLIRFCSKYGIILAYDNAYSEVYFEKKPHSILEIKGAKEIAVEFHSFSKTFCMTGLRIGWAAGNEKLIRGLLKVKTNIDSGIFGGIQEAAAAGLDRAGSSVKMMRKILKERRDIFVAGLKNEGFDTIHAEATFYVWVKIPRPYTSSIAFSRYLLNEKRIVAAPGIGFGACGEGFVRFALTVNKDTLQKAIRLLR